MKAMRILGGLALVVSVALNLFLWRETGRSRVQMEALNAAVGEAEAWRAENEALKTQGAARSATSDVDTRELARLRDEVGQLRKQTAETEALRAQAGEARQLRVQLTAAKKNFTAAESELAEVAKLTPEETLALKGEAHAATCVSNLKQIGLAAHLNA